MNPTPQGGSTSEEARQSYLNETAPAGSAAPAAAPESTPAGDAKPTRKRPVGLIVAGVAGGVALAAAGFGGGLATGLAIQPGGMSPAGVTMEGEFEDGERGFGPRGDDARGERGFGPRGDEAPGGRPGDRGPQDRSDDTDSSEDTDKTDESDKTDEDGGHEPRERGPRGGADDERPAPRAPEGSRA